jgi:HSP20 family molecular chaperone IbpA
MQATYDPTAKTLTIAGTRNVLKADGDSKSFDRTFTFRRGIPIPPDVDATRPIVARALDGVLTIEVPKKVVPKTEPLLHDIPIL